MIEKIEILRCPKCKKVYKLEYFKHSVHECHTELAPTEERTCKSCQSKEFWGN